MHEWFFADAPFIGTLLLVLLYLCALAGAAIHFRCRPRVPGRDRRRGIRITLTGGAVIEGTVTLDGSRGAVSGYSGNGNVPVFCSGWCFLWGWGNE